MEEKKKGIEITNGKEGDQKFGVRLRPVAMGR